MAFDEISAELGYENPGFFRRLFKRQTSLTPGQYRRMFQPVALALVATGGAVPGPIQADPHGLSLPGSTRAEKPRPMPSPAA